MEQMTNAEAFQFWVVGLCIAVSVVILTVTALWFTWKRRPANHRRRQEVDTVQPCNLQERLAQLTQQPQAGNADPIRRAS